MAVRAMRLVFVAESRAIHMAQLTSDLKMFWIHARFIPAGMVKELVRGEIDVISHFVSETMGTPILAIDRDLTIATRAEAAYPNPAAVAFNEAAVKLGNAPVVGLLLTRVLFAHALTILC